MNTLIEKTLHLDYIYKIKLRTSIMFLMMHDEIVFSARIISNKLLFPEVRPYKELKNSSIKITFTI